MNNAPPFSANEAPRFRSERDDLSGISWGKSDGPAELSATPSLDAKSRAAVKEAVAQAEAMTKAKKGFYVSPLIPTQDDTLAEPPNAPGRMIDPTGGNVGPLGARGA